jgi:hypothetical protein
MSVISQDTRNEGQICGIFQSVTVLQHASPVSDLDMSIMSPLHCKKKRDISTNTHGKKVRYDARHSVQ